MIQSPAFQARFAPPALLFLRGSLWEHKYSRGECWVLSTHSRHRWLSEIFPAADSHDSGLHLAIEQLQRQLYCLPQPKTRPLESLAEVA